MTVSSPTVKPGNLRRYTPFRAFTPESLIVAAGQAELVALASGARLLARGAEAPLEYFLIRGELDLIDEHGHSHRLVAGAKEATLPIAAARPAIYDVVAAGSALCFVLPRDVITLLASDTPDSGASVEDLTAEVTQTRAFFEDFRRDLEAGRVTLPPCPDLARSIRRAVESHRHSARDIARIISVDPAIAARVLKVANSPVFRGRRPVELLPEAVTRIGMHTVAELVVCFTLRDVVRTEDPRLKRHFRANLEAAVNVAALAETIAVETRHAHADAAMVAGLLHNIGFVPILEYATRHPAYTHNFDLIRKAARNYTGEVGRRLAEAWSLSERYRETLTHARDFGYAPADGGDLTSLVISARYLFLGRRYGYEVLPEPRRVPAVSATLGRDFSPDRGAAIAEAARESVVALQDLIMS